MSLNGRLSRLERRSPPPLTTVDPLRLFDSPEFRQLLVEVERDEIEEKIEAAKAQLSSGGDS
jgi:hypothetical protein